MQSANDGNDKDDGSVVRASSVARLVVEWIWLCPSIQYIPSVMNDEILNYYRNRK